MINMKCDGGIKACRAFSVSAASSSPCSCWRPLSLRPPWAAARSWPDETEESASAWRHPDFQTASSRMSSDRPWRPTLPPAGPPCYHWDVYIWKCLTSCETGMFLCTRAATAAETDPPPGAAVRAPTLRTNCCRDKDTSWLPSCDLTMYLHRYENNLTSVYETQILIYLKTYFLFARRKKTWWEL